MTFCAAILTRLSYDDVDDVISPCLRGFLHLKMMHHTLVCIAHHPLLQILSHLPYEMHLAGDLKERTEGAVICSTLRKFECSDKQLVNSGVEMVDYCQLYWIILL